MGKDGSKRFVGQKEALKSTQPLGPRQEEYVKLLHFSNIYIPYFSFGPNLRA